MNEQQRIMDVFDNWYYKGVSITIGKRPLSGVAVDNFSEFLKWRVFFGILETLKPNLPEYKIFDAGCGNGNVLRKLIEYGAEPANCIGMDASSDALEHAVRNSPAAVTFQQGLIDQTDLPDESVDLIFCLGVLIHILDDDYIRLISKEFKRIMKKDGLIIILVSEGDLNIQWPQVISHTTRNFAFSKNELQNCFPEFECIVAVASHGDTYAIPASKVLEGIEKNTLDFPFKIYGFAPKEDDH